ncbi:unnamed protein product [Fructobacillus tropaeoli]|nr:hypothetical protein FEFB_15890 [Fructobacillus sp. EFB-N1]CAK1234404.1 unnamed protein product [Fructobacillus tropaeoli]
MFSILLARECSIIETMIKFTHLIREIVSKKGNKR